MTDENPADRMDQLLDALSAVDDRPHARLAAMVEELLTDTQWRELEAAAERQQRDRNAA